MHLRAWYSFLALLLTSGSLFASSASDDVKAQEEVEHILKILVDKLGTQRVADFVKMPIINGRPVLIVGELHNDMDYTNAALQVRDCSGSGDCVFFQEGVYHECAMEKQVRLDSGYGLDSPLFGIESPDLIPVDLVERSICMRNGAPVDAKINPLLILISCQAVYKDFWIHFRDTADRKYGSIISAADTTIKQLTEGSEERRRMHMMQLFEPTHMLKRFDKQLWAELLTVMAQSSMRYFKTSTADVSVLSNILTHPNMQQLQHLRNTYLLNRRNQAFVKAIRDVLQEQPGYRPAVIWVGRAHVKELYTMLNEDSSLHLTHAVQ